jgi:hypothetical protein
VVGQRLALYEDGQEALARGLTSDLWPANQPSTWSKGTPPAPSCRRAGAAAGRDQPRLRAATSSDRRAKASRAATVRRSIARNPLSFTRVIAAFSPCLERVLPGS